VLEKEEILLLSRSLVKGVVKEFDEPRGIGYLQCGQYGKDIFFHCTQLSDKTRSVEAGREVLAELRLGKSGLPEAYNIIKL
jgi:cold shock CspA family protein